MSVMAKEIRENIARSRAAGQKGDLLKCLGCLRGAVGGILKSQVFGREKFEIDALLIEALRDLNSSKTLQRALPKGIPFKRGGEKKLYAQLSLLHDKLKEAIERARIEKMRQQLMQLDDYLLTAHKHLQNKEVLEARKLFRAAAERFTEQPGLLSDIGTRMLFGGLVQEAVEYLRRAMDADSRDERAHLSLISCYEALGQSDQVDLTIRNAIRLLGPREDLYLRLAKSALQQRNWSVALESAETILKSNPIHIEARKIRTAVRPKIFVPPSQRATPTKSKQIKVDPSMNLDS